MQKVKIKMRTLTPEMNKKRLPYQTSDKSCECELGRFLNIYMEAKIAMTNGILLIKKTIS